MKSFKQIILTLCLLCSFVNNVWAASSDFDFSVLPITNNVYSIIAPSYGRPTIENRGWNSNSHFLVTGNGVLVFDTGSSEFIGKEIIKAIKSVTAQPVRWVVNSHSHADHWLGNGAFADLGAEIISTGLAVTTMNKDGPEDVRAFSRMTEGATGTTALYYPTSLLAQRQKRNFGGVDVEFILSNDGHSPGDVLMWLPKQKIIFGGDVLSSDWMPIMTPRGNVANLIDTLSEVVKLEPNIVLTGHGGVTTVKSVIRDINFLDTVLKMVKVGNAEGKKANDILLKVHTKLGSTYKTLYKDYDSNSEYLVEMIFNKQQ